MRYKGRSSHDSPDLNEVQRHTGAFFLVPFVYQVDMLEDALLDVEDQCAELLILSSKVRSEIMNHVEALPNNVPNNRVLHVRMQDYYVGYNFSARERMCQAHSRFRICR